MARASVALSVNARPSLVAFGGLPARSTTSNAWTIQLIREYTPIDCASEFALGERGFRESVFC